MSLPKKSKSSLPRRKTTSCKGYARKGEREKKESLKGSAGSKAADGESCSFHPAIPVPCRFSRRSFFAVSAIALSRSGKAAGTKQSASLPSSALYGRRKDERRTFREKYFFKEATDTHEKETTVPSVGRADDSRAFARRSARRRGRRRPCCSGSRRCDGTGRRQQQCRSHRHGWPNRLHGGGYLSDDDIKDQFHVMQGTVVGDRNNNGLFSCDTPLLFSPTAEENVSLILLLKGSFWG